MAKQKKFRFINFYIGKTALSYGIFVDEEEYPFGEGYAKRHILKQPIGINKLIGKKFTIEGVDEIQRLTLPIVIDGMQMPFHANIYFHDYKNTRLGGVWPVEKETQLQLLRDEVKSNQAYIGQLKKINTTLNNENRAFKAEMDRLTQEKAKRDKHYVQHVE